MDRCCILLSSQPEEHEVLRHAAAGEVREEEEEAGSEEPLPSLLSCRQSLLLAHSRVVPATAALRASKLHRRGQVGERGGRGRSSPTG